MDTLSDATKLNHGEYRVYDGLVVLDAVLEFPVPLEQGLAQLRGQLQVYNNKQCSFAKKPHKSLDWNSNKYYI